MPSTPHTEKHFTSGGLVRDLVVRTMAEEEKSSQVFEGDGLHKVA
jgi:hypothetical protein